MDAEDTPAAKKYSATTADDYIERSLSVWLRYPSLYLNNVRLALIKGNCGYHDGYPHSVDDCFGWQEK